MRDLCKQALYVSDIEPVSDVAFLRDGWRVATVDVDLTARVWDLRAPERPLVTMHADLTGLMCVALSPDERRLVAGEDITQPNRVKVWDVVTGQELAGLTGHKSRITDVAFWPDGNTSEGHRGRIYTFYNLWSVVGGFGGTLAIGVGSKM